MYPFVEEVEDDALILTDRSDCRELLLLVSSSEWYRIELRLVEAAFSDLLSSKSFSPRDVAWFWALAIDKDEFDDVRFKLAGQSVAFISIKLISSTYK